MTEIIAIQSFRYAAGRSTLAANLAALLAAGGRRVCAIDTHFHAPGLHIFFGIPEDAIAYSLNSFLLERGQPHQAIWDITERSSLAGPGRLFLLPASPLVDDILPMLRHEYDLEQLDQALQQLQAALNLDFIILDCPPGLNQDTLTLMAIADTLALVLRPEPADFQGTAVMVDVARRLGQTRILLALNDVPASLDGAQARREMQRTFESPVAGLLPHSDELLLLGSRGLIALRDPDDLYSLGLNKLLAAILETT